MKKEITAEQKLQEMLQKPVDKLICSLAIPTITSMVITSVYNMADTFFVGRISTSATGAVGVSFSLMAVIQAIGFTFGVGSGNYVSKLLGQEDREKAAKVAATGFFSSLILGTLFAIIGFIFLDPLVRLLGATETIAPHAKEYLKYILIGTPYMAASFVLNNILRFQGSAFYAMIGIGAGGVINIILDPIFIFGLNMGVGGAALATIISQLVSFCILFFNSGIKGNLGIKFRNFSIEWKIYKEILLGGLPSFYRQSLASIAVIFLNFSAGPYGDAAIAAMSIVARIVQFELSLIIGFGHGFQPVCGFNYGAKKYGRVLEAFWFSVKTLVIVQVIAGVLLFAASPQLISFFRKEDPVVVLIGTRALQAQCLTLPLFAWILVTNMLLQVLGKARQASILAIARQGMFYLPAVLLLPHIIGILGIQISQPVSDILTFSIAFPFGKRALRELGELQNNF